MRLSVPSPPGEARTVRAGAVKFLPEEAEAGEGGGSGGTLGGSGALSPRRRTHAAAASPGSRTAPDPASAAWE